MDGAQVGIIQARGVAWPFHTWFKERDQACCCKVPSDSLLASTVKAWVLELHIGLSFYQGNNSSGVAAFPDTVWTLSSCCLNSPAGRSGCLCRVCKPLKSQVQENTVSSNQSSDEVCLFPSEPSVCLSPGISYQIFQSHLF